MEENLGSGQEVAPKNSHHYRIAYLGIKPIFYSLFHDYYNNFDSDAYVHPSKNSKHLQCPRVYWPIRDIRINKMGGNIPIFIKFLFQWGAVSLSSKSPLSNMVAISQLRVICLFVVSFKLVKMKYNKKSIPFLN